MSAAAQAFSSVDSLALEEFFRLAGAARHGGHAAEDQAGILDDAALGLDGGGDADDGEVHRVAQAELHILGVPAVLDGISIFVTISPRPRASLILGVVHRNSSALSARSVVTILASREISTGAISEGLTA